jgi:SAM-dependent methyltransferase
MVRIPGLSAPGVRTPSSTCGSSPEQLDSATVESAAGRVVDVYQRHAVTWSRERGDRLQEKAWLDRFLALLPGQRCVLDIGCGSGVPIAGYLIANHCQVTGVDASTVMITMCLDRFPEQHWQVADMRTLDLDRTFDGILAWDSLFHLPRADQRSMFGIFRRHAAAGAALMFTAARRPANRSAAIRVSRCTTRALTATSTADCCASTDSRSCGMWWKTPPAASAPFGLRGRRADTKAAGRPWSPR